MSNPIIPINGKVLLGVEELTKKSAIHNPDALVKTQFRLIDCQYAQTWGLSVGDLVIYDKSKGLGRELNGKKYVLVAPEYIFGIIEEDE